MIDLRGFVRRFGRKRSPAPTPSGAIQQHAELHEAWQTFQAGDLERALALASAHLNTPNAQLAVDTRSLVGLIHFRRKQYGQAFEIYRELTAARGLAEDWFNLANSATLAGKVAQGADAFERALAAYERGDHLAGGSIPLMRFHYADVLREAGEYASALAQIQALRSIYEKLRITDTTFLFLRGVPPLEQTMRLAMAVFGGLGTTFDWKDWLYSFAVELDEEGREYLYSLKRAVSAEASS